LVVFGHYKWAGGGVNLVLARVEACNVMELVQGIDKGDQEIEKIDHRSDIIAPVG
jgi:hypothetical protein